MSINSHLPTPRLAPRARTLAVVRALMLGVAMLGVGSLTACAKARAANVPDGPPLSVPQPPDRVVAPSEPVPVASAPPLTENPPPPTAAPPPRTPPRQTPPPREAGGERPQPPPPATPPATAPPAPPTDATRDLRPAASNTAAAERAVRDVLTRANRDLSRIDYGKLSADGRAQYDQSKRFSQQAEQALKERNIVFASTLAEKAATLAAELSGR